MKSSIKQTAFIIIGLAIISVAFLLSKSSFVHAAKKEGMKFDDWTVACLPKGTNDKAQQTCFLTQQVSVEQNGAQQVIAVYQIGYTKDNVLHMIQVLPLGISLEAGTSIVSSKNLIAAGRFSFCTQAGCQAVTMINDEDLKKILNNSENSVAFMSSDGKQMNLPLSNKGLLNGLNYLKE